MRNLYFALATVVGSIGFAMPAQAQQNTIELSVTGATALKLYVMDCGHILARDLSIFSPGVDEGASKEMSVACYVVEHPNGTLVWDTGLPDALIESPDGIEYYDGAFNFSVKRTMQSQLAEIGLAQENIDFLALSHLHSDHVGNANAFATSTWLVQLGEHDAAFGQHPEHSGFDPKTYSELADAKTILLSGDHDVFGDGSVVILSAPGHSPGHQVLFVDLSETGPVILSGDLYHYQSNRENYRIPIFNDKPVSVQSFARIDNIIKATGAELWMAHDLPQFKTMKLAPLYYK